MSIRVTLPLIFLIALQIVFPQVSLAIGGDSSGGGPGVATYRENKSKTLDNLIKVESLVLYRARRSDPAEPRRVDGTRSHFRLQEK